MTPEQENDAVMKAAMLEWVMDALAGNEVCDFGESFVEVAAAKAAREALENVVEAFGDIVWIPGGKEESAYQQAQNTLRLLGNFDPDSNPDWQERLNGNT